MTELIVSVDNIAPDELVLPIYHSTDCDFFKFNASAFIRPDYDYRETKYLIRNGKIRAFFDLKVYDTRDTVYNICRRAFDFGAEFITVCNEWRMIDAAFKAKTAPEQKIIAVDKLSDDICNRTIFTNHEINYDGFIVNDLTAIKSIRSHFTTRDRNLTLIVPGVRPFGYLPDNHISPHTPRAAALAGADFIVIGRPITTSVDPVNIVRNLMFELSTSV